MPDIDSPYSLVVFKGAVTNSRALEKAISKRLENTTLVIATRNLSQEAADLLAVVKGYPLALNDFYWTDERYKNIQEFGGIKETPREKNS